MKKEISGCFYELDGDILTLGNRIFEKKISGVNTAVAIASDNDGLSLPHMRITLRDKEAEYHLRTWQDLPVIEVLSVPEKIELTLQREHWLMKSVAFAACTDYHDNYCTERMQYLMKGNLKKTEGNLFFFENSETGEAQVLVVKAPDYISPTVTVKQNVVTVETFGCDVMIGFCREGEGERLVRDWYRHMWVHPTLHTMSNTWGDCNLRMNVHHDFVKKEIDTAAELGLDIVQIDDGWQTGNPSDPSIYDENHMRQFLGDFWELDTKRFPEGIKPLSDYAASKGVKLGLWFAPHSRNDFELLERDIAVLRRAHDEWGIRYFKLDMLFVTGPKGHKALKEMLAAIHAFGPDVTVEMDVTNGRRFGFLCEGQYGTLFMENRYVRSANAFPYRVLRNVWNLAPYLPTAKCQFELVNPDVSADDPIPTDAHVKLSFTHYNGGDPFVPSGYDMDYLFAVTMLSNPLFWMEVQCLRKERREELLRLFPVWKEHRDVLALSDVTPIGERPSGRAMTGLCAISESGNGKEVYLTLFREDNDRKDASFVLPVEIEDATLLASNGEVAVNTFGNVISASFDRKNCYAFMKATRK